MRGFSTPIKLFPLRPSDVGARNQYSATQCWNAKSGKEGSGFQGYIPDVVPFPDIVYGAGYLDLTIDWPFPQIFRSDSGIYIGKRDGLYLISPDGTGGWVASLVSSSFLRNVSWPWTFANTPMFPIFASGDLLVYYDYASSSWINWSKTYAAGDGLVPGALWSSDWYPPVCACFFRGQIIVAGSIVATTSPSHSRRVQWSEIGAVNFLGKSATPQKNIAGELFLPTDDKEIVQRVLELAKIVIVYGTFGVYKLIPMEKPAPGFGCEEIIDTGINSPLAVAGNMRKHLMLDRTGCLYTLTPGSGWGKSEVEVKPLGYEEFLYPLVSGASFTDKHNMVSIVYNSDTDEFYISNGKVGYIYDENGLTQSCKHITSLITYQDAQVASTDFANISQSPVGIYQMTGDRDFIYATNILDFGLSSIKLLEGIDIGGSFDDNTSVDVMVAWRNNKRATFSDTNWKRVSPEGFCAPLVSGVEFIIYVRMSPCQEVELNTLTAKVKVTDKRFVRGMYTQVGGGEEK